MVVVRNVSIPVVALCKVCSGKRKKKRRGLVEREEGHVGESQHTTLEQKGA